MNNYTIILNAYIPHRNLYAQNGVLQPNTSSCNFHALNGVICSREKQFLSGWNSLFFPENGAQNTITIYGDNFEQRFIRGCLAYVKATSEKPIASPQVEMKPLPEACCLPLEKRWELLDSIVAAPQVSQMPIAIILYGSVSDAHVEQFEKSVDAVAKRKIPSALKHGVQICVRRATTIEEVEVIAQSNRVGGVLALQFGLECARMSTQGRARIPIVQLVPLTEPEMVSYPNVEGSSDAWFYWRVPVSQSDVSNVGDALLDYIEYVILKPFFIDSAKRFIQSGACGGEITDVSLNKLTGVTPHLFLPRQLKVPRGACYEMPQKWSANWHEVFPEIQTGYELSYEIKENSIAMEFDGENITIPDESDSYGEARIELAWNGGDGTQTCIVEEVHSSLCKRLELNDAHNARRVSKRVVNRGKDIELWMLVDQDAYKLPFEVYNEHDELTAYACAEVEMVCDEVFKGGLTAKVEGNALWLSAKNPGDYFVTVKLHDSEGWISERIRCIVIAAPSEVKLSGLEEGQGITHVYQTKGKTGNRQLHIAEGKSVELSSAFSYENPTHQARSLELLKRVKTDAVIGERLCMCLAPACYFDRKEVGIKVSRKEVSQFAVSALSYLAGRAPVKLTFGDLGIKNVLGEACYPSSQLKPLRLDVSIGQDQSGLASLLFLTAVGASIGTAYSGFGISMIDLLVFSGAAFLLSIIFGLKLCEVRKIVWGGFFIVLCAFGYCLFEHLY